LFVCHLDAPHWRNHQTNLLPANFLTAITGAGKSVMVFCRWSWNLRLRFTRFTYLEPSACFMILSQLGKSFCPPKSITLQNHCGIINCFIDLTFKTLFSYQTGTRWWPRQAVDLLPKIQWKTKLFLKHIVLKKKSVGETPQHLVFAFQPPNSWWNSRLYKHLTFK
jgi:hypothetical protein